MLNANRLLQVGMVLALGLAAGCSDYRASGGSEEQARDRLHLMAKQTIKDFLAVDPTLKTFIDNAYGYAVFPEVTKGAVGVGGAHGRGVVYRDDRVVGYATLTQGTIGAQLGGQKYQEIIFFENQAAFDNFTAGTTELSAQASAVAASQGASADADYAEGVAVFTLPIGGLMFEASVGGQKFSYQPR